MHVREQPDSELTPPADPLARLLHSQGQRQPQACLTIREDAHHPRVTRELLREPFQPIGATRPALLDTAPYSG